MTIDRCAGGRFGSLPATHGMHVVGADADAAMAAMAADLPYLTGMMAEVAHDDPDSTLGWCDDQTEFEFGLDLILDGLDRLRANT